MTDQEALNILTRKHIEDLDDWCKAIYITTQRLHDCQWYDYNPDTFSVGYQISFGSKVILGIRYDDGSRGSVDGVVLYSSEKRFLS